MQLAIASKPQRVSHSRLLHLVVAIQPASPPHGQGHEGGNMSGTHPTSARISYSDATPTLPSARLAASSSSSRKLKDEGV